MQLSVVVLFWWILIVLSLAIESEEMLEALVELFISDTHWSNVKFKKIDCALDNVFLLFTSFHKLDVKPVV